ncbi:MAG: PQQ-binding-like beta-propeller repeat protein, partial [Planctomycetota bacterium]
DRVNLPRLPYAGNLVNLLVVDDLPALLGAGFSAKEVMRVLCPNGVAYLGKGAGVGGAPLTEEALKNTLAEAGLKEFRIVRDGGLWARVVKPRPADTDEWTHSRYGPGGVRVSRDAIGVPNRLQWVAGLPYPKSGFVPFRYAGILSANGRNFYLLRDSQMLVPQGQAAKQFLVARDAFNGLVLWRRPLAQACNATTVAVGDRVFTVLDDKVVALNAADGQVAVAYEHPGPKDLPRQILVHQGILLLVWTGNVCALDAATGALKWTYEPGKDLWFILNWTESLKPPTPAFAGDDRVFFSASSDSSGWFGGKQKAEDVKVCIMGLDVQTGQEKWRKDVSEWMRQGASDTRAMKSNQIVGYKDGLLLLDCRAEAKNIRLYALAGKDGSPLWTYRDSFENHPSAGVWAYAGFAPNALHAGGLIWVRTPKLMPHESQKGRWNWDKTVWKGLDPATGQEKRNLDLPPQPGCWADTATERFFIRGRPSHYVAWEDGKLYEFGASRSSCGVGSVVANGFHYSVPNACACVKDQIRGFAAFCSGDLSPLEKTDPQAGHPLESGPAAGPAAQTEAPGSDEWPTLRHDPLRSGGTAAAVPANLSALWSVALKDQTSPSEILSEDWAVDPTGGDPLTAPVAASGRVYVGLTDAHRLVALDAGTGKMEWSYTAGGRLDAPPTVYAGLCLFGCRDGWAYGLRCSDGKQVWRFRAAPEERRIISFGQLESPWPVAGGVLVEQGKACFLAGRSTSLEGGLYVHAVDPATGKRAWTKREPAPEPRKYPFSGCGDMLVSDGKAIAISGSELCRFNPVSGDKLPYLRDVANLHSGSGALLMDRYWRWREDGARVVKAFGVSSGGVGASGQMAAFNEKTVFLWNSARGGGGEIQAIDMEANRGKGQAASRWKTTVPAPLRFRALILAGDVLFAAGPDNWEIPKGGELWAIAAKSGEVLNKQKLPAPPVADGLAASGGRLYISSADGTLTCMGK